MADVLKFNSVAFLELASKVRKAATSIAESAASINRIHLDEDNGGHIKLYIRQNIAGQVFTGDTAEESLKAVASGLSHESALVNSLRNRMLQVHNKIIVTERKLGAQGSITINDVIQILHYPADTNSWSTIMWDNALKYIGLPTIVSAITGGYTIGNDTEYCVFNAAGKLIKQYKTEKKIKGLELTIDEYNPNNNGKTSSKYDLGFPMKGKNKKTIKEPKILPKNSKYKQDKNGRYHDENGRYVADYIDDKGVKFYDKNGNPINAKKASDASKHKQVGTVFEASIHHEASIAAYDEEFKYETDDGISVNAKADVLKAEAHADFKGGLYVEKVGPDGKSYLTLSPGVSAEVGASVEAAHASLDVRKEFNDYLSAGIGGDITVGKAQAVAAANFGIVDGKVAAQASASAEAIAFAADVHGDVNIAGVDVKGSAGVTVGIGAHAKAGYYNGVISCDVGLSVGLGIEGNVELDVSGVVDTISKVAENAGQIAETVGKTAESVRDYMKDATEDVQRAAEEAANSIYNFFSGLL